ncbi:MAG: hypothetical protein ACPGUC_09225, partial [Gammaproteobacteria bacterium]
DLSGGTQGMRFGGAVFNLDGSGNGIDQTVTVSGPVQFGELAIVDGTVKFDGTVDVAPITDTESNNANSSSESVGSGSLEMRGGNLIANADFNVDGDSIWAGGTIGGSAAVDFAGSLEIIDTPSLISGTTIVPEAKRLNGEIGVDGKVRWSASDTVSGDGLFGLFAGSTMEISGNGTFNPEFNNEGGSISKTSSGTTTFNHVFDQRDASSADGGNTAQFSVQNGKVAFTSGFEQESGSLILDGGDVEGNVILRGGELTGSGTIMGNLRNIAGTIAPGFSPGSLSITGDLILETLSKLILEIGGNTSGTFDQIKVDGKATLGGELIINAINNFDIDQADGLSLLTAAVISGAFSAKDLPAGFELNIGSNGVSGSGADVLKPVTEEVDEASDAAVEDAIEEVVTLTANTQKTIEVTNEAFDKSSTADEGTEVEPGAGDEKTTDTGTDEKSENGSTEEDAAGDGGDDENGADDNAADDEGSDASAGEDKEGEDGSDEEKSGEDKADEEKSDEDKAEDKSDEEKSDEEKSDEDKADADEEGTEKDGDDSAEEGKDDSTGDESDGGEEGSEDGDSKNGDDEQSTAGNDESGQEADESEQDPELIAATSGACGTN